MKRFCYLSVLQPISATTKVKMNIKPGSDLSIPKVFSTSTQYIRSTLFLIRTLKEENQVSVLHRCPYCSDWYYLSNRKRFSLKGSGEFSTVMQTLECVSGLHTYLEITQPLLCLYQAMQIQEKRFLSLL